ncbi:acyltransferase domain-containing protein [Hamadaea tsunoensis]|uniref:acyltransferase domain-containing protein n=1 Tax=Hamadaea tsunoensis TaxID=53368 RepID=UPI00146FAEA9|nr:acyltransferase domain-containing protein [Hamadaea tsunoensis]
MPKRALMFPGQGAYLAGLLPDGDRLPRLADLLSEVDAVAGECGIPPVHEYIVGPPEAAGDPPDLAIFASELACAAILDELGLHADAFVGHSFGEWGALAAAHAVSLRDAIRLIGARAAILQSSGVSGAMVAVRTDARRAAYLVGLVDDGRLAVAVDNGPDQVVIAGPAEPLALAERLAAEAGISTATLPIAYPFHSPVFTAAQHWLSEITEDVAVRRPDRPVYSPLLGRWVAQAADVREIMGRHLIDPVGFYPAILLLQRAGFTDFVECGARDTLAKIILRALPGPVTAVAPWREPSTMDAVADLLHLPRLQAPAPMPPSPARAPEPALAPASAPAPVPAPRPEVAAVNDGPVPNATTPDADQDLPALIRAHYAEKLGFPAELLTEDLDLEADLGVDSLKQTEPFQQIWQRVRGDAPPSSLRPTAYTSVRSLAALLREGTR